LSDQTQPTNRPNILWISLEDTSPRFGCYGDPVARTPNIDRLAAGGTIFRNAFSTAGVCAPSRSAIITGMYQTSIGTHHMRTTHKNEFTPELPTPYYAVIPPYVKTFTEYLRAAGYYCTNNRKTDYQFEAPFTAWDECSADAHWRNREEGQPFFAVFNPILTHESSMWEKDSNPPLVTDPDRVVLPPYLPDTPRSREALARQYDNIAQSDKIVGRLLDQLEEDGLAENTIVFLWSDHGEGLPRAKRWPYDAGIRIPLIVRYPGQLAEGQTVEQLVSLVDLAPTVLSLAKVGVPAHMQGAPFIGPKAKEREYVFAARDRYDEAYDMVRAVRDSQFKYIRNYYPEKPYLLWIPFSHKHPIFQEMRRLQLENKLTHPQTLLLQTSRPVEELYDCANDPYEINNLADDPAYGEILERMRSRLDEWRNKFGDLGDVPEETMVRRMWPDGVQPVTAAPIMVPLNYTQPGLKASIEGTFEEPTMIMLHTSTQGASVAYRIVNGDEGEDSRWRLYTGPIELQAGETTIRAKAVRIGYRDSEEAIGVFRLINT
jgi:N-sulfoglucosamine sulfohydrolase